ncbi:hypothetical protein AK830_g11801 [Neonectria ditissima]|uniref:Uncharacterized protein n=1 Tax=Neonectria ditissima TaxID=78410 RepID=A0A0P7AC42_9HYPO|nr:hypothetical protein AK830_g11801 [Neonectria ditissima]
MPSYLVTGSSRGIGLGLVAELLKDKKNVVIATARNTAGSSGLQDLKAKHGDARFHLLDMDVIKLDSVHAAAEAAGKLLPSGLDHLISNAGVSYDASASWEDVNIEDFMAEMQFNLTSPIYLLREFLPLIRKGEAKKILIMTSSLGSVELAGYMTGLANTYSVAKASLNMLIRKWSTTLKNDGITTFLLHPGWVGVTELGSKITNWMETYAPQVPSLTVAESAAGCINVLNGVKPEDNGLYFSHDGTKLPW